MLRKAITEIIAPLLRRVGSLGAGAALAAGAKAEHVEALEAGFVALGLVVIDLALSHWNRKGK